MRRMFKRSPNRQRSVEEVRSPRHPAERLEHTVAAEEAQRIMNERPDPTPAIQSAQSAPAHAVSAIAHAHAKAAQVSARIRGIRAVAKPMPAANAVPDQGVPTAVAQPLPERVFFGGLTPVLVPDDPRIPEAGVMSSSPIRTHGAGAGAMSGITEQFEVPPSMVATATSEDNYGVQEARFERDTAMLKMVDEQRKYQQAFGADAEAGLLGRIATSPRKFYAERRLRKANREFNEKEKRFLKEIQRVQEHDNNIFRQAQSRAVRRAQQEDRVYGRYYATMQPGRDINEVADRGRRLLYPHHPWGTADLLSGDEVVNIHRARADGHLPDTLASHRNIALRRLAMHPDMPGQGAYDARQRILPIPWERDDPSLQGR